MSPAVADKVRQSGDCASISWPNENGGGKKLHRISNRFDDFVEHSTISSPIRKRKNYSVDLRSFFLLRDRCAVLCARRLEFEKMIRLYASFPLCAIADL